ncbi:hypothetical protein KY335_03405 [Candidatus Woesearchaeota archaeon]|nr:hypothetical protein [Candidatus Woesearchaeota archaeon]MBW3014264.1 hypothetical protein [Candidatus Woesearchaeota archaeon]
MIKILGTLDILAGVWTILLNFSIGGMIIGIILAGYLLLKGILFRESFLGYVDIFCAVFIFILVAGVHTKYFFLIPAIYLFQKGIVSYL